MPRSSYLSDRNAWSSFRKAFGYNEEIAGRQLHTLRGCQGPRDKKPNLTDVKEKCFCR
jgi:hypothetical protein